MPRATYQYLLDTAGTQFEDDLIARGLAVRDQVTGYDITDRVLETAIQRGRQSEMESFGAGTMTLLLDNADKRFTPDYGASPLYPYVRPGSYIKARAIGLPDYTNLVSWWSLNEADNSTRFDSHGTSHLTPNTGTNGSVDGKIKRAARFTGGAEILQITTPSELVVGNFDFSFCAWVYLTNKSGASQQEIGTKGKLSLSGLQWRLYYDNSTDRFVFSVTDDGVTQTTVSASVVPSVNTWYFLSCGHDSVNDTIWITYNDGGVISSNSFSAGVYNAVNGTFWVGSSLYGYVDEPSFWRRTLSTTDISALYNSGDGHGYYFNATGGVKDLFTGFVRRVTPQPDDENQTCTLECTDLTDRFGMALVTSGLHQSKTTGELLYRLLSDGVSWRIDRTDIDAGQDTVSYAWWTAELLDDALKSVETSEWGQFYVDGRGYPCFSDRNARGTAATATGVVIGDDEIASAEISQDIEDVFNEIRIQAHPRITAGKAVQIWRLRQTLTLTAGQTLAFTAQYTNPETDESAPALNVVTPVAATDYSANTAATGGQVTSVAVGTAGSGYDMNKPPKVYFNGGGGFGAEAVAEVNSNGAIASITVTDGGGYYTSAPTVTIENNNTVAGTDADATASVNVGVDITSQLTVTAQFRDFGEAATLILTNNSGGTMYVPYMRLRGDPLIEPDTTPATRTDGQSIADYFRRTMEIDQPWQQSTVTADTIAGTLLNRYDTPKSRLRLGFINWNQYLLSIIVGTELDRMLSVSYQRGGIAGTNYFIGSLEHRISEGGRLHQLTVGLERSRVDGGAVYDSGIYDTSVFS